MNEKQEAKKAEDDYKELTAAFSAVAESQQGKLVLWEILSLSGLYDNQFTGNSSTFFNEGRRSIGLDILKLLEDSDPTIYARMLLARQELIND